MKPGVSIIICCHNGARRLPETVKHLAEQKVPSFVPWEFILVDNASSDNSVEVTEAIWDTYHPSGELRVVRESRLGLSFARARGFEEAKYEYIIMCDDDNWLMPDYVALSYMIMWQNARIGALGGVGRIVYEEKPPKYIEHSRIFAAGEQWHSAGKVLSSRLYGAGCVIRKSAYFKLKEVGFKSLLTDRKGAELSSGGDHELCYALSIIGYDIWYDDRLRFSHFITKERLTWTYFMRYAKESTVCFDVLTSYKMVALDLSSSGFPFLALARDFLYCVRRFAKIWVQGLFTKRDSIAGNIQYFRYVILRNKLLAYFTKFKAMVKNHEEILQFKDACVRAKLIEAPPQAKSKTFSIFSSKPSRQPQ